MERGELEIIQLLQKYGSDINVCNGEVIAEACKTNHIQTVERLIKNNIAINSDCIFMAFENNNLDMILLLYQYGADITINDNYFLCMAAKYGFLAMVELLVMLGANVTARNNTPIQNACEGGYIFVVQFLIDSGANVTANDNNAIKIAEQNGHSSIVQLLTKNQ